MRPIKARSMTEPGHPSTGQPHAVEVEGSSSPGRVLALFRLAAQTDASIDAEPATESRRREVLPQRVRMLLSGGYWGAFIP